MKIRNLSGMWKCTYPDGREKSVRVPGCFDLEAGVFDIGGPVIYEKTFRLEDARQYARIRFSGVSYYCDVYLNGTLAGSHEGMWDGFTMDIGRLLREGENRIRVEVTKPGYAPTDSFPLRQVLSGFIPDVLSTFGGIWDDVQLETAPVFFVNRHFAAGDCGGHFTLHCEINANQTGMLLAGAVIHDASGKLAGRIPAQSVPVTVGENHVALRGQIDHPALWSPDAPALYRYRLTASMRGQETDAAGKLAFREIKAEGTKILLNGKPVYLRGVLHWGYYDDERVPNPTEAVIRDEIRKSRAYGFNAIKHCLYIPRRRYLDLMDEEGMLAWVELPLWQPTPAAELENRIRREYPRILEMLQGHPSVVIVSLGCELNDTVPESVLSDMYALAKQSTDALVRDNSGSGECYGGLAKDFADFFDYHFYADLQNMENLMEAFTPGWRNRRPWVFGEFCDCDTLRDLQEIRRRKHVDTLSWEGSDPHQNPIVRLKPDFYLGHHDARMERYGIRDNFRQLYQLSVDHAMVHRKVTVEQTRSFPEICGYNITCIRDVPITTSGLFDDCMEPKFDARAMRAMNGDVLLLPAWDLSRVWINADRVQTPERYNFTGGATYALHVLASNYAAENIESGMLSWQLLLDGEAVCRGGMPVETPLRTGAVTEAGYIAFRLPERETPASYILHVSLQSGVTEITNDWPVFVYPQRKHPGGKLALYDPCGLFSGVDAVVPYEAIVEGDPVPPGTQAVMTSLLTREIREYMRGGGKVFLLQRGRGALPVRPVAFWRESFWKVFAHSVLADVQKSTWLDDLRYFGMSTDTAFDTDAMEDAGFTETEPLIRRYDCRQWIASDYMTAFRYGNGACVAATLRLEGGMGKEPLGISGNPFAVYLLHESLRFLLDRGEGNDG